MERSVLKGLAYSKCGASLQNLIIIEMKGFGLDEESRILVVRPPKDSKRWTIHPKSSENWLYCLLGCPAFVKKPLDFQRRWLFRLCGGFSCPYVATIRRQSPRYCPSNKTVHAFQSDLRETRHCSPDISSKDLLKLDCRITFLEHSLVSCGFLVVLEGYAAYGNRSVNFGPGSFQGRSAMIHRCCLCNLFVAVSLGFHIYTL
jgi:hypothetical protein